MEPPFWEIGRVGFCIARPGWLQSRCASQGREAMRGRFGTNLVCVCAWITACAAISCAGSLPAKQGRRVAAEVLSV